MPNTVNPLRRRDAQVTTLQVEVQAIKIGPKQMSLSVFRQLPMSPLIEHFFGGLSGEMPALRGIPWGTVNYFWPGCDEDRTRDEEIITHADQHLHIVWQLGERLYRDCVYPPSLLQIYNLKCPTPAFGDELIRALWAIWKSLRSLDQLFIAV